MRRRTIAALAAVLLLVAACTTGTTTETTETTSGTTATTEAAAPVEIVLLTHDSFAISQEILDRFTERTGIRIEILEAGDAGSTVNQAILTKDNPIADVLFGVDNTFLGRALAAGIFIPYASPLLASVPDELEIDPEHRVTPIDFGDVCINYDKAYFATTGLPVPQTLRDLTDPMYRSLLVVENPATSSPGLAFLLATVGTFGEPGESDYSWHDYWTDLVANDVLVTSGWEEAYYGAFSGGSGEGDRPLVVSYASSPPAEVIFAPEPLDEAPTGVMTDGCFRQIEFAGILAGTEHETEARQVIDLMLSVEFQEDIPLNMFVFPANAEAELPPEFVEHTVLPEDPITLDPALIDENRERWIEEWTAIVLG